MRGLRRRREDENNNNKKAEWRKDEVDGTRWDGCHAVLQCYGGQ